MLECYKLNRKVFMQINVILGVVLLFFALDSLLATLVKRPPKLMNQAPGDEKNVLANFFFSLFILFMAVTALLLQVLKPVAVNWMIGTTLSAGAIACLGYICQSAEQSDTQP